MTAQAQRRKAYLQIHFCVLLWGFTAILGKSISLHALPLVAWRMLLVVAALAVVPRVWRSLRGLPRRQLGELSGIGVLVALHWLTFYGAIKLANASVAATCIALAPVFLAVLEPAWHRRRPDWRDLLTGVVVVPGVALVMGGIPRDMLAGLGVGVLSAVLVAAFSVLNKAKASEADPLVVTAVELGSGTLALCLIAAFAGLLGLVDVGPWLQLPSPRDASLLLVLALACTLLPFSLSLLALRQLSAFSAQLAVNLEPIYAIMLAALFFSEQRELGTSFYLGALVVVAAVFVHPLLHRPLPRADAANLSLAEGKTVDL